MYLLSSFFPHLTEIFSVDYFFNLLIDFVLPCSHFFLAIVFYLSKVVDFLNVWDKWGIFHLMLKTKEKQ